MTTPNAQPTPRSLPLDERLPDSVTYQLGNLDLDLDCQTHTLSISGLRHKRHGAIHIELSARDAFMLLTFFTMPHVQAMIEQAERLHQQDSHNGAMMDTWLDQQRGYK